MAQKRVLTVVLLAGAAVLIFLWARAHRDDAIPESKSPVDLTMRAESQFLANPSLPPVAANVAAVQTKSQPPVDSLYSTYRIAANFSANFAAFTVLAARDPEAQYFRARIFRSSDPATWVRCWPWSKGPKLPWGVV